MKRKPLLSFTLSLLSPGLGQMYNGQLRKGILYNVGFNALSVMCLYSIVAMQLHQAVNILLIFPLFIIYLIIALMAAIYSWKKSDTFNVKRYNRWYFYLAYCFASAIFINMPLTELTTKYLVKTYKVPTGAMEKTILIGDFLLAEQSLYKIRKKPAKNDIIVFTYFGPKKKNFIKRIVALSGDSVMITGKSLYVNGQSIDPPAAAQFIHDGKTSPFPDIFYAKVPKKGDRLILTDLTEKDGLFAFHLIKQENPKREVGHFFHVHRNGEFINKIPLMSIDSWVYLESQKSAILLKLADEYKTDSISLSEIITIDGKPQSEYTVQYNNYFVLGDNRDNSFDSRYY